MIDIIVISACVAAVALGIALMTVYFKILKKERPRIITNTQLVNDVTCQHGKVVNHVTCQHDEVRNDVTCQHDKIMDDVTCQHDGIVSDAMFQHDQISRNKMPIKPSFRARLGNQASFQATLENILNSKCNVNDKRRKVRSQREEFATENIDVNSVDLVGNDNNKVPFSSQINKPVSCILDMDVKRKGNVDKDLYAVLTKSFKTKCDIDDCDYEYLSCEASPSSVYDIPDHLMKTKDTNMYGYEVNLYGYEVTLYNAF